MRVPAGNILISAADKDVNPLIKWTSEVGEDIILR
jgi:hypothetical protein